MDDLEKLQERIAGIATELAKGPKVFSQDSLEDCLGRMEIPIDGINEYLRKIFGPYYKSIGCTITFNGNENVTVFSSELCPVLFPSFQNLHLSDTIIFRFFLIEPETQEFPAMHEEVEITFHANEYEVHHNGNPPITHSTPYFNYLDGDVIRNLEKSISESFARKMAGEN